MNAQLLSEYRKQRGQTMRVGYDARDALTRARTVLRWERLESAGLVKLEWEPDDSPDLSWLDQDCYKEDRQGQAIRKRTLELAERDGCWGLVGFYRIHPDAEWQTTGASVWGFIGTDACGCEPDIMAETIDELVKALKARCPRCRRGRP